MHGRVQKAVEDYEPAGDLVEEDVLVKRQDDCESVLAKLRDRRPEHHHEDEHWREVEALTWSG